MTRMTSLFTHTMAMAALGLFVTTPALAQSRPQPSRVSAQSAPAAPARMAEAEGQASTAPTPQPPMRGQQQGQGQMTPPAAAPRAEAPRMPYLGPNNQGMPAGTNIRLELAITDTYTGAPAKKTVSLLLLTGNNGMIRTNNFGDGGVAILNVDAIAAAYQNGQVSVRMTFEYTPARPKDGAAGTRPPTLNESITVVLQDGKPLVVSQSADPATDRKVTAELTATILK